MASRTARIDVVPRPLGVLDVVAVGFAYDQLHVEAVVPLFDAPVEPCRRSGLGRSDGPLARAGGTVGIARKVVGRLVGKVEQLGRDQYALESAAHQDRGAPAGHVRRGRTEPSGWLLDT